MRRSVNPQTTLGKNQDGTSLNLSLVSGPAINSNLSQRQSRSGIRSPENSFSGRSAGPATMPRARRTNDLQAGDT
ncbi:hypothetical protein CEXT_485571 [Caerostris extrusa]|uniref:Uncharacterized protein n=1 Tax=Caerostris extrusa TaxID=172846 RepID=A0AAV4VZ77_CAEEX|nr:hypothetical protein CEXT_485571 [Caerostris extrusa]